ncbi:MAG: response regulator [Asticcacaulis sp.]
MSESVATCLPKSVLIVDDHEINRRILGLFLEPLGWNLTMAANGAQALDSARIERFDLILMDMMMPVMNGLEATAALRVSDGPNRHTPVIAVTGMDDNRMEWQAAGVSTFLIKPVDPERLLHAVIEAVSPSEDNGRKISA